MSDAVPRENASAGEAATRVPLSLPIFVFLGAFLLFALAPMVGRVLLPRFGGAFHVWTTALMFFQGALFLAYAYAHLIARRLGAWHLAVLLVPLAFFPLGDSVLDGALGGTTQGEAASIGELVVALAGPLEQGHGKNSQAQSHGDGGDEGGHRPRPKTRTARVAAGAAATMRGVTGVSEVPRCGR
jgi:hypothetical protein